MSLKPAQVTSYQFATCRIILGGYLALHFVGLWPHAAEVFSDQGMLPDPSVMPTWGVLPNLFWLSSAPWMVHSVLATGVILAALLTLGVQRRLVALLLWVIWASLFNRNILISNPSLAYVGMLLLLLTALPRGEQLAMHPAQVGWALPRWVYWGLLIALMGGYTVSGLHKLNAPSWVDGSALGHVLNLPLARDYFLREWISALPQPLLKAMTWSALGLEILALPLTLLPMTRRWIWLGLLAMNLGILTLIGFADLTSGVLIFHLFTFNRHWVAPAPSRSRQPVVLFDGVCNLCNSAVDFIVQEDTEGRFRYAPLSGETATIVTDTEVKTGQTMALLDGETVITKSDAVLEIAAGLGGLWRVVSLLRVLPRSWRNAVYFQVQSRRYDIFGKRESCRLPSPSERALFLP